MCEFGNTGDLRELINTHPHVSMTQGFSGVEVYHIPELSAYLKVGETGKVSNLARERDVLRWLDGKFPVPRVIGYEYYGPSEALLISEISGVPGSDHISAPAATEETIIAFARSAAAALRRLHELPVEDCPIDMRLDARFARSRISIELELLSETNTEFAAEHDGMPPWDVYDDLVARRPDSEDLVFTHGDPCMPNVIVKDGEIAGFIDMDGAGVADRYVDIAIFFRSFHRNSRIAIDLENVFLDGYGIDSLDLWKMEYYKMLDDLF
jgi:aminoglycoside phosphotransferase